MVIRILDTYTQVVRYYKADNTEAGNALIEMFKAMPRYEVKPL